MIRVALTDAAYDAIASTLPKGAARVAHAAQAGPMFYPSRGGGGRPHEGYAQARRTMTRNCACESAGIIARAPLKIAKAMNWLASRIAT
jgi:hypothetical protein